MSQFRGLGQEVVDVAGLAMEYFFFELTADGETEIDTEKRLLKKAEKLPRLRDYWGRIKDSLVLASSALEIQVKFITSTRCHPELENLFKLEAMTREMAMMHPAAKKYCRVIMTIITHLMIYRLNISAGSLEKLVELCAMLTR
jgi:hypothetical protein